jgi:uncharacterized protein YdhG (YjbR/CyaY superfamily)
MPATKNKFTTVDQYITTFPKEVQVILEKVRQTIKKAVPDAEETIGYQMPSYKLNGTYLVHFAAWKSHIGFYATPSGHEAFRKELSQYKSAKGSVQFPLDEPIPYDLIKKIVIFRKEENQAKNN